MRNHPDLYVGSIVQVIAEDCIHLGVQGQIVGFDESDKKTPIRVWFGKESDHLMNYPLRSQVRLTAQCNITPPSVSEQANDPRTWSYARKELTICSTWNMKTIAERYFKDMHHTYYEPTTLFVSEVKDCDVENCINNSTERIVFNIWGSVMFADVCSVCAPKYHLLCGEVFPWKRQ